REARQRQAIRPAQVAHNQSLACENWFAALQLGGRYGGADLPEVRNPVPNERWVGKGGSVPARSSASGARHGNAGALSSLPSPVRGRRNTAPFLFSVQEFPRSRRWCGDRRCGLGGL